MPPYRSKDLKTLDKLKFLKTSYKSLGCLQWSGKKILLIQFFFSVSEVHPDTVSAAKINLISTVQQLEVHGAEEMRWFEMGQNNEVRATRNKGAGIHHYNQYINRCVV